MIKHFPQILVNEEKATTTKIHHGGFFLEQIFITITDLYNSPKL